MDRNHINYNMEETNKSQIDLYYQGYHNFFKLGTMIMNEVCKKSDVKMNPILINMITQCLLVTAVSKDPFLVTVVSQ